MTHFELFDKTVISRYHHSLQAQLKIRIWDRKYLSARTLEPTSRDKSKELHILVSELCWLVKSVKTLRYLWVDNYTQLFGVRRIFGQHWTQIFTSRKHASLSLPFTGQNKNLRHDHRKLIASKQLWFVWFEKCLILISLLMFLNLLVEHVLKCLHFC